MHLARFTTPPTAYLSSHVIKMVALAPETETKMAGTGLVMLSFVIWPSIFDTGLLMQIATHGNLLWIADTTDLLRMVTSDCSCLATVSGVVFM